MEHVHTTTEHGVTRITLNNPEKRNALGIEMFDAIDGAIDSIDANAKCVLLSGEGSVFCSGFDMKACAEDISILGTYIKRLSMLIRALRRLHCPVVVAAHGAAIAGGCAVLTGCDFVFGSVDGKYGYPVHQLGISPAVTIPTLYQKLGEGRARALVLSGEIVHGTRAFELGLLSHLEEDNESVHQKALELASALASKPPYALQTTKEWLNALDGSLDDDRFDKPANDSASSIGNQTQKLLSVLWKK
ncbi:enoyl-CoA hydratase/isomerase family protein [bacterium]|nr:enoyl-CoA hydratase/isomerase family protein [bacterium]